MPECHLCEMNGQGSMDCLDCRGPADEPSHKGRTFVSIEAMGNSKHVPPELQTLPDRSLEAEPAIEVNEQITEFCRFMVRLPNQTRDILCMRLADPDASQNELGRRLGIGQKTVHRHLRTLAANLPRGATGLDRVLLQKSPPGVMPGRNHNAVVSRSKALKLAS